MNANRDLLTAGCRLLIADFNRRLVIEVEANETHTGAPRCGVQALFEAVGANVAIKDRDFSLGIDLLDLQGVLQRRRTAMASAEFFARADALDHDNGLLIAECRLRSVPVELLI